MPRIVAIIAIHGYFLKYASGCVQGWTNERQGADALPFVITIALPSAYGVAFFGEAAALASAFFCAAVGFATSFDSAVFVLACAAVSGPPVAFSPPAAVADSASALLLRGRRLGNLLRGGRVRLLFARQWPCRWSVFAGLGRHGLSGLGLFRVLFLRGRAAARRRERRFVRQRRWRKHRRSVLRAACSFAIPLVSELDRKVCYFVGFWSVALGVADDVMCRFFRLLLLGLLWSLAFPVLAGCAVATAAPPGRPAPPGRTLGERDGANAVATSATTKFFIKMILGVFENDTSLPCRRH